jgi:hypothetical protein
MPCRSGPPASSGGSNQAPVTITAAPGITPGSIAATARQGPHALSTRTVAVADAVPRRVLRADADWLAGVDLIRARHRPGVLIDARLIDI